MSMTIIVSKTLAAVIPSTLSQLQHALTTITNRQARIVYSNFVNTALAPKETVQITTAHQLKHPDSPLKLKREISPDEVHIVFHPENGLMVIAGSKDIIKKACTRAMMLIREQCISLPDRKPRFEEIFWNGTIQNVDYTM